MSISDKTTAPAEHGPLPSVTRQRLQCYFHAANIAPRDSTALISSLLNASVPLSPEEIIAGAFQEVARRHTRAEQQEQPMPKIIRGGMPAQTLERRLLRQAVEAVVDFLIEDIRRATYTAWRTVRFLALTGILMILLAILLHG